MTEHPNELLLEIADGAVPPVEARAHLGSCRRCQQTLAALAPLDLGYAWQGVAADLDAPRPGLLERFLVAFGVRPGLARFTATAPSLRLGWLLANLLVLGLVALPMVLGPVASAPSAALLAAPLVAAAAVAFAYGPASTRPTRRSPPPRCRRCRRCWCAWRPSWSPTRPWPAWSTWSWATDRAPAGCCP